MIQFSDQYYKQFTIGVYEFRVVLSEKLPIYKTRVLIYIRNIYKIGHLVTLTPATNILLHF